MVDAPSPEEFRATGFTADAVNYPHSEAGFAWLCRFNGIRPDQAPRTWRYASSEQMRTYIQSKADAYQLEQSGAPTAQAAA